MNESDVLKTTMYAVLICETCGRSRYHAYDTVQEVRNPNGKLSSVKLLYRCVICSTVRTYGNLRPSMANGPKMSKPRHYAKN